MAKVQITSSLGENLMEESGDYVDCVIVRYEGDKRKVIGGMSGDILAGDIPDMLAKRCFYTANTVAKNKHIRTEILDMTIKKIQEMMKGE